MFQFLALKRSANSYAISNFLSDFLTFLKHHLRNQSTTTSDFFFPSSSPYAVCCCLLLFEPFHRPLAIPLTPPPTSGRHAATIRPTHTRRPCARRRPRPTRLTRTRRARRPPHRATPRPRSGTIAAARAATRTIPSAPPPPAVDRAATATARPLPAGCHTEHPTDTTHTVSKQALGSHHGRSQHVRLS